MSDFLGPSNFRGIASDLQSCAPSWSHGKSRTNAVTHVEKVELKQGQSISHSLLQLTITLDSTIVTIYYFGKREIPRSWMSYLFGIYPINM